MKHAAATVETEEQVAPAKPDQKPAEKDKPKRQPRYAVVLHNDSINGFDFVVGVLIKIFGYSRSKAFWLTMKAHVGGKSHVWTGSFEVAELKADQIRSCGADPNQIKAGAKTLRVSLEPLR